MAAAVVGAAWSCDKVSLTAPTQSTITLYATATVVSLGSATDVTATVIEQAGTPVHDGTMVTFTNTLGTVEPREAATRNGKATVKFNAGSVSGTAKIGAFSGAAKATEIELKVGGAAAGRVQLNATPAYVSANGGTVQLSAVVTDTDGNRLPSLPVTFTASAGVLASPIVSTDSAGEATTTLVTNRESNVTATAGNVQSSQVTIRVNTAPGITISSSSSSPQAGQPVTFTVNVSPASGGVPVRDVTVNYGDGSSASLGALAGSGSVSHVYKTAGTYTVSASVVDMNGERATVSTVVVVTPLQVSVAVSVSPTAPRINQSVTVTAAVSPSTVAVSKYVFDFGDGFVTETTNNTVSHAYTTTGIKTIRVSVYTAEGQVIVTSYDVSVSIT